MHVQKVTISNILGIEHLEFEPGKFTTITGKNGKGKSSVLGAMQSALTGGQDATLLRAGQEKGEVVLLLDDGTKIRRRVTEKTNAVTVDRDGVRQDNPRATIDALADMFSVNPIAFLHAPEKKRVDVMLETLPMSADPARLAEITGGPVVTDDRRPAMEQIASARQRVFDERTGTNRAIREKEGTISQLNATLPAEDAREDRSPAELEAQIATLDEAQAAEMKRIDAKLVDFRAQSQGREDVINTAAVDKAAALRTQIEALQAELSQVQSQQTSVVAAERAWMVETNGKAELQRTMKTTAHAEARAPLVAMVGEIRRSADAISRAAQTRDTMRTLRTEADALVEDAARQTAALEGLDAYKSELLAALPIPGLEVRDGSMFRNGVAFERLNTAQQVEIAVDIAKLRAGDLGIVCVDGLEQLDTEHFEAFRTQAAATDLQFFVTRVGDGALNINVAA